MSELEKMLEGKFVALSLDLVGQTLAEVRARAQAWQPAVDRMPNGEPYKVILDSHIKGGVKAVDEVAERLGINLNDYQLEQSDLDEKGE